MGGSSKKVTVGYRYLLGMHMGVSHGPVDALLQLKAGDRTFWTGTQTGNTTISIDRYDLFGGDKREGGIKGSLRVRMGAADQTADAYLSARQSGPQPGYRGLFGLIFDGIVSANNPYIKPWAIKVRRILQGWQSGATAWYSAKASITLSTGDIGANPAHIIYECLTNIEWGMGYSPAQIDLTSFAAAADTFYSEGLGLCMMWSRQDTIDAFIQVVMDHAGAVLGQDRSTGLFILRPIRGGYTVSALPLYDQTNIIALDSYQRASLSEAINELTVSYTDIATAKTSSVTVQNLANITSQGGIVAQSRSYPGLATSDLALRTAMRDLRSVSTQVASVRMRCNRTAYTLLPGDLIRLNWPKLGISNLVLRVLSVNTGTLTDGSIQVDAVEDVFGLPAATYSAQQPNGWVSPNTQPVAVANRLVEESSYYELVRTLSAADLTALPADAGYLAVIGSKPSDDSMNFDLLTRSGTSGSFTSYGAASFAPTGTLTAQLLPGATSATITNMIDVDLVEAGTYAVIGGVEIVRIDTINAETGALTLGRGVMDSVATTHASGARIFFAQDWINSDNIERVNGEVAQVKMLPSTGLGTLAEASAPTDSVTFARRQLRPYPPGQLRINSQAYPTTLATSTLTVSWAHRNRLQQNLQGDESGNIGPEAGVTYNIRFYDGTTNALREEFTGLTGTSQSHQLQSTVLLMNMNGANGSTTFTDVTGNTVTAVGNAQISTAQSKFGGASAIFDGIGDALTLASSTNWSLTNAFAVELWVYLNATNASGTMFVHQVGGFEFFCTAARQLRLNRNSSTNAVATADNAFSLGQWTHLAATWDGSVYRIFVDGALAASASSTTAPNSGTSLRVGSYSVAGTYDMNGYMDDLRITKGLAVYTTGFTPPAAELTLAGAPKPASIRIELESSRAGYLSRQKHNYTVAIT